MILFTRLLEIFSIEQDTPIHSVEFDTSQTSFDFISPTEIVVADDKGRITLLTNISSEENIAMKIIETGFSRIKSISAAPDFSFFVTLVSDDNSAAFWNCEPSEGAQRKIPTTFAN